MTDLRKEFQKYIGKLGSTVVDSKIQFSLNFIFRKKKMMKTKSKDYSRRFDSETGVKISDENLKIHPRELQKFHMFNAEIKDWKH